MKKNLVLLLTMTIASTTFASQITGRIMNLVQDEEGMKIIIQQGKLSATPVMLYLDSKSQNFANTISSLKLAKDNSDQVQISTVNGTLEQITNIKVLGK